MTTENYTHDSYWRVIWKQFRRHRLGMAGLFIFSLFCLVGIYAPLLASSKPLVVYSNHHWYFPLFRYLTYQGFYTKRLDIFFNLLIFTAPCMVLALAFGNRFKKGLFLAFVTVQIIAFIYYGYGNPHDPGYNDKLEMAKQNAIHSNTNLTWNQELVYMSPYEKLNLIIRYHIRKEQNDKLKKYGKDQATMSTLYQIDQQNEKREIEREKHLLETTKDFKLKKQAQDKIDYILERKHWIEEQEAHLQYLVMPLLRPFHWEDDAGGEQSLNKEIDWFDLTRINRKDLTAALLFGVRISLTVGLVSVALALLIGIPVGSLAGFYGGTTDIIVSRLLEIWESMPTFFMLLLVVAVTQSKSIFLVIAIIGIFGWTDFSRYIRGEFFKQRNLSYVEACRSLGFNDRYIMFQHILPNAIPPLLILLPFAVMGAISSEAGLSFLGLGEENSCSWGVLMDEGRTAFPGESYLLWPPALLLTVMLIAIALIGDALRDSLDPKMHQ